MPQPFTSDTLRAMLREELNDRFEHYEKRQEHRHQEIMHGFGQVVETLSDHVDERFNRLERLLTLERRVELIDQRTRKLAQIAGHPELTTANF